MSSRSSSTGYSARVQMRLHLPGGEELPVAQSALDFLILKMPAVRPPSDAVLVVDVDGSISRYPCYLQEGIAGRRINFTSPQVVVPV